MGNVTNRDAKKTMNKSNKRGPKKGRNKFTSKGTTTASCAKEVRDEYEASKSAPGRNDIAWYNAYPQLLKDAGTFSFNNPLGSPITVKGTGICRTYNKTQPGVIVFNVAPTFGYSTSWSDPINVAARRFYTFIRHANSGHANYDAPNLMMYLMAVDSVYSMIAHMNRIYGLLQMFSVRNRYYPAAILTALGLDYNSFVDQMADFRYFINNYTAKAASLCVPNEFTFYRRHAQLYQGVYLDAPNDKAQTYVFKPAYFYKYVVGAELGQASLDPVKPADNITLAGLKTLANQILDSILLQEDMNIMSGDILKAYGREGLYSLAMMPEDYTTGAVYNPEMMMQIHNATILNVDSTDYLKWKIKEVTTAGPDEGSIWMQYPVALSEWTAHLLYDRMVDMHLEDPTPEDIMLATRLTVSGVQDTSKKYVTIKQCGSEVIVDAMYYVIDASDGSVTGTAAYEAATNLSNYAEWSKFHDAPLLYNVTWDDKTKTATLNYILGELDNYSVIPQTELAKLHDTALTSLLTAPTMAGLSVK